MIRAKAVLAVKHSDIFICKSSSSVVLLLTRSKNHIAEIELFLKACLWAESFGILSSGGASSLSFTSDARLSHGLIPTSNRTNRPRRSAAAPSGSGLAPRLGRPLLFCRPNPRGRALGQWLSDTDAARNRRIKNTNGTPITTNHPSVVKQSRNPKNVDCRSNNPNACACA